MMMTVMRMSMSDKYDQDGDDHRDDDADCDDRYQDDSDDEDDDYEDGSSSEEEGERYVKVPMTPEQMKEVNKEI